MNLEKFKKSEEGFTIAEVLISIMILAIVFAGGMSFYFNSNEFMAMALHKKIALEMAANQLETVKSKGGYDCIVVPACFDPLRTATITFGTTYQATVSALDYPPGGPFDSQEVRVSVVWAENGKYTPDLSVNLVTYMAP